MYDSAAASLRYSCHGVYRYCMENCASNAKHLMVDVRLFREIVYVTQIQVVRDPTES